MAETSQQHAALLATGMQSMRSRILERKLVFLQRVLGASSRCVSGRVTESLSDDISSLCLVKECRELEEVCGVTVTEMVLKGELMCDRNLKEEIRMVDHELLLKRCAVKAPLIAEIEERIGWARLWDATLNFGVQHTRGLQMLSRIMSHHGRGNRPCPLCDTAPLESSVMEHLLGAHCVELGLDPGTKSEMVLNWIVELQLVFLAKFRNIYSYYVT